VGQLHPPKPGDKQEMGPAAQRAAKKELQGVFIVNGGKAQFREIKTGITGATDIEVLSGLNQGDQIVTGSYEVIRTIRNDAKVKIDNKRPVISSGVIAS